MANRKLCNNGHRTKTILMFANINSKHLWYYTKLFLPQVQCFFMATYKSLQLLCIGILGHTYWTFHMAWGLPIISTIGFHLFFFLQFSHQNIPKYLQIIPDTRLIGFINTSQPSSQNTKCNLIAKFRFLLLKAVKLVACKMNLKNQ